LLVVSPVLFNAAKQVIDWRTTRTLMPIASEEEAEVARKAFVALNASEYGGARIHLATASERLTAGDSPGASFGVGAARDAEHLVVIGTVGVHGLLLL
jgi:hypothetical protein